MQICKPRLAAGGKPHARSGRGAGRRSRGPAARHAHAAPAQPHRRVDHQAAPARPVRGGRQRQPHLLHRRQGRVRADGQPHRPEDPRESDPGSARTSSTSSTSPGCRWTKRSSRSRATARARSPSSPIPTARTASASSRSSPRSPTSRCTCSCTRCRSCIRTRRARRARCGAAADPAKAWDALMLEGKEPCRSRSRNARTRSQKSRASPTEVGIQGTPGLVFANGKLVPGAISAEQIEQYLNVPGSREVRSDMMIALGGKLETAAPLRTPVAPAHSCLRTPVGAATRLHLPRGAVLRRRVRTGPRERCPGMAHGGAARQGSGVAVRRQAVSAGDCQLLRERAAEFPARLEDLLLDPRFPEREAAPAAALSRSHDRRNRVGPGQDRRAHRRGLQSCSRARPSRKCRAAPRMSRRSAVHPTASGSSLSIPRPRARRQLPPIRAPPFPCTAPGQSVAANRATSRSEPVSADPCEQAQEASIARCQGDDPAKNPISRGA